MADNLVYPYNPRQAASIDVLPNEVFLTIFDFYVVRYQELNFIELVSGNQDTKRKIESWQSLVHVCQRWRYLVFESPCRLDLQLQAFYPSGIPASKSLDVWPALPLLINGWIDSTADNVIAAAQLGHSDRIRQINLYFDTTSQIEIEKIWTAMQVPFPELAGLYLGSRSHVPVLPDSFLGGSAPRLRFLILTSIPFPGLPKLYLSATNLACLWLLNIPHSGYISPEAMATCLSSLTSLQTLQLEFESPRSSPEQDSRHSPPPTRSILPALTVLRFKGVNEYLEELVARIDTPRLNMLSTKFFNDIDFDTPELIRLISHSSTLNAPIKARVSFDSQIAASVKLQPQASSVIYFEVEILCREPDWQLSSLAQICATSLPLLSSTKDLFICERLSESDWKNGSGIDNIEWLELLLPFAAVENLYLSKQFAPLIAPALQEITTGGTTEVLYALQNLYLRGFQPSGSVEEGIERFVSARQLTDHPVAVSVWD